MRNRSMALVVRDNKILIVRTSRNEIPGGGIEPGETPAQAALRELKEETGLDGIIRRELSTLRRADGSEEYVFWVDVDEGQEAVTGKDPEVSEDEQRIREVLWIPFHELSEKDRAFLWSYGLMDVDGFFDVVQSWGDIISYPDK